MRPGRRSAGMRAGRRELVPGWQSLLMDGGIPVVHLGRPVLIAVPGSYRGRAVAVAHGFWLLLAITVLGAVLRQAGDPGQQHRAEHWQLPGQAAPLPGYRHADRHRRRDHAMRCMTRHCCDETGNGQRCGRRRHHGTSPAAGPGRDRQGLPISGYECRSLARAEQPQPCRTAAVRAFSLTSRITQRDGG